MTYYSILSGIIKAIIEKSGEIAPFERFFISTLSQAENGRSDIPRRKFRL